VYYYNQYISVCGSDVDTPVFDLITIDWEDQLVNEQLEAMKQGAEKSSVERALDFFEANIGKEVAIEVGCWHYVTVLRVDREAARLHYSSKGTETSCEVKIIDDWTNL
jgi:hypothetical protein